MSNLTLGFDPGLVRAAVPGIVHASVYTTSTEVTERISPLPPPRAHVCAVCVCVCVCVCVYVTSAELHIMDVKMGQRTFMESECANKKKRMDLLQKMVKTKKESAHTYMCVHL